MTQALIDKFLVLNEIGPDLGGNQGREVGRVFIDTLACIHAGWDEPVGQRLREVHPDVPLPLADGSRNAKSADPEAAALVLGTAAHALDFDDVHTTSVNHPSAVIVPAIEAMVAAGAGPRERAAGAYVVGLAVNIALGEALGFDHYQRGWHATSTIGPLSSAAACAYLMGADESAFRSAISIAAAQAGGMQRNFGTMAKPLQAGLAASAGVRAARLAVAGVTAAPDGLGTPNGDGYLGLYRGKKPGKRIEDIEIDGDAGSLSRKLYGCCYQAHRPIAAALHARRLLDPKVLSAAKVKVEVLVPYGTTGPLRVKRPATGLEGKFSGQYAVATALLDGEVTLAAFEDDAVRRDAAQSLLRRVELIEDKVTDDLPIGINHGTVRLTVKQNGQAIAKSEVAHFPGSPENPFTEAELEGKVRDCLAHAARHGRSGPSVAAFMAGALSNAGLA